MTTAERELSGSPPMPLLFARAAAAMVPGASRLPFVGGGGGEIPEVALTIADLQVDRARLADYDRVCGFPLSDTLPATYPHMLAFPLHLALMTDGRFPYPAIGLVHIANRIVQHRPLDARAPLSLRVWATPPEPHPRGAQFAIRTEARSHGELVWEEVSTNLRRGHGDADARVPEVQPSSEGLPATATWRCPGDLGRRYGAISGDINPIHVHPLGGRLFGFRSAIAHGMWTKARCLAALGNELADSFAVEVVFKRPILLPATVQFAESNDGAQLRFGVRDAERETPHLDGRVSF